MTKKEQLAKEYAERNYVHEDDWPNNSPSVIAAKKSALSTPFKDGWEAAMEEAATHIETAWTNIEYAQMHIPDALALIARKLREEDGTPQE